MYKCTIINGRRILLSYDKIVEVKSNGKIYQLTDFSSTVKIGDKIGISNNDTNTYYVANNIIKINPKQYICEEFSASKSLPFLTPLLTDKAINVQYNTSLVNTYCGVNHIDGFIYLLYRIIDTSEFMQVDQYLTKLREYVHSTTTEDLRFMLFKFYVPTEYYNDYKLFLQGGYSKMSDIYKKRIMDFHHSIKDNKTTITRMNGVLYRTKERKQELETKIGSEKQIKHLLNEIELYSIPLEKDEVWIEKLQ